MDLNYFIKLMKILLDGTKVSLRIFAITLIFAIPLGILVSALSISKNKIISKIIKLYILLMRGTPLLLQIICIYFAPYYLFKFSYNRFIAVIISFTLNYAAYFGEIFRGGIESIPKGQWEVAFTLGFTKIKTFFIVILPQAIKRILPSISNEVITLVRDTSLAQVIGVTELFAFAQKQANYKFSIIPLLVAGLIYLLISVILTYIFNYTERKLEYYR
jgi:amino ABC transporter, permease protein, 3-TM region, his/glu/gln/arg/opine family